MLLTESSADRNQSLDFDCLCNYRKAEDIETQRNIEILKKMSKVKGNVPCTVEPLGNSETSVRLQFCSFPSAPLRRPLQVEIKLTSTRIIRHVYTEANRFSSVERIITIVYRLCKFLHLRTSSKTSFKRKLKTLTLPKKVNVIIPSYEASVRRNFVCSTSFTRKFR